MISPRLLLQTTARFLAVTLLAILIGCSSNSDGGPGQGSARAPEKSWSPATFDLYAMFGDHQLAPTVSDGSVATGFQVRNVSNTTGDVSLEIVSEAGLVDAGIETRVVSLQGANAVAEVPLTLKLKEGAPEDAEDFVQVRGTRGEEEHVIFFRVKSLSSAPALHLGRLEGEVLEREFKLTSGGAPVDFLFFAANLGAAPDTFPLDFEAPAGWDVRFLDLDGAPISEIRVKGLTQNYLLEQFSPFVARVVPPADLVKNRPREVRVILGPGRTGLQNTDALSVRPC